MEGAVAQLRPAPKPLQLYLLANLMRARCAQGDEGDGGDTLARACSASLPIGHINYAGQEAERGKVEVCRRWVPLKCAPASGAPPITKAARLGAPRLPSRKMQSSTMRMVVILPRSPTSYTAAVSPPPAFHADAVKQYAGSDTLPAPSLTRCGCALTACLP
eukprot:366111-Chlamydomonas_euryale.AAC.3